VKGSRDERGDGRRASRVYIAYKMVVWLFGCLVLGLGWTRWFVCGKCKQTTNFLNFIETAR
jgi:hypothetical protein